MADLVGLSRISDGDVDFIVDTSGPYIPLPSFFLAPLMPNSAPSSSIRYKPMCLIASGAYGQVALRSPPRKITRKSLDGETSSRAMNRARSAPYAIPSSSKNPFRLFTGKKDQRKTIRSCFCADLGAEIAFLRRFWPRNWVFNLFLSRKLKIWAANLLKSTLFFSQKRLISCHAYFFPVYFFIPFNHFSCQRQLSRIKIRGNKRAKKNPTWALWMQRIRLEFARDLPRWRTVSHVWGIWDDPKRQSLSQQNAEV